MHWYLTVTHISDCEINSVTLNTIPLICKCYMNGLCNITDWSNKKVHIVSTLAVNHCRVLSKLKHSNLKLCLIINSLIARYTRIQLMITQTNWTQIINDDTRGKTCVTFIRSLSNSLSLCIRYVSIGGSMVECSPATRAIRVRFPADAMLIF